MSKIVFIGGGNMAEALLKGSLGASVFNTNDVVVTDIRADRLSYLENKYKIKTSLKNIIPVEAADVILLAIKPQNMEEVLEEIKALINEKKLIVSIAAGVTIKQLQKEKSWKIVRIMPNTPALIGQGIAALCSSSNVKENDKKIAEEIFKAVGKVVWVNERDINAITALSGSGPAFVYRLADYLIQAGKEVGLKKEVAKELVLQTFIGSAEMLAETEESPDALVKKVASPGGTTVAGLEVLDKSLVKNDLIKTIKAAKKRADELGAGK
ncbi:MAG: pyrroline-5-carboxylate reductase [Candidatus Margulisbacteria bacterium]|nr:pyrroline-5-carboxylate reductase [Candidatus Margulisiibacteriota bacterium]